MKRIDRKHKGSLAQIVPVECTINAEDGTNFTGTIGEIVVA